MRVLEGVKPEKVFYYFEEISKIPRGSGNEEAAAKFCVEFAKQHGLSAFKDEQFNVLIKKPGSPGKENNPAVILQGHLDMVCEKNAGVNHDFLKDPLKLKLLGDNISAEGTTLGADNGIAIAIILAVLEDKDAVHPPLECLMTSMEEVGLEGAAKFDYSKMSGKYLINLDGESYGKIIVSCAGGLRTDIELAINWLKSSLSNPSTYAIRVRGLTGGHSGTDIHLERANANKTIGHVLDHLYGKIDFEICHISGGMKDNAIPRESQAYINISSDDSTKLETLLSDFEKTIIKEFKMQENNISIKGDKEELINKVFSRETAQRAISIIMALPNGVIAKSFEIEGLVETSNNLGVITMEENSIIFSCAIRSSVESRKEQVESVIKNISLLADAKFSAKSRYPGWQYDSSSNLQKIAMKAFNALTGRELKAEAIHAGLECGIIKEKLKETDMIAMGPDMSGVHTPEESISISSTEKIYELLIEILKNL